MDVPGLGEKAKRKSGNNKSDREMVETKKGNDGIRQERDKEQLQMKRKLN